MDNNKKSFPEKQRKQDKVVKAVKNFLFTLSVSFKSKSEESSKIDERLFLGIFYLGYSLFLLYRIIFLDNFKRKYYLP